MFAFLLARAAAAADVYTDPAAFTAVIAGCAETLIGFEDYDLAVGDGVDERYRASHGVTFSALVGGLTASSTVSGEWGLVRDSRAGLVQLDPYVLYTSDPADVIPTWAWAGLDTPTPYFAAWFVDVDAAIQLEAWTPGNVGPADLTVELPVEGDSVAGGVYAGVVFDAPVDRILLTASRGLDEWAIDDVQLPTVECLDADGDGVTPAGGDCDDTDAARAPGTTELCNGVDDDCDEVLLPGETDADRDGWLDCEDSDRDGVSTVDGDCAPFDATVHPGAEEGCDGLDTDCDGLLPTRETDADFDDAIDCVDTDLDGVATADGDCAPADPTTYPGALEICDGVDNDCDDGLPSEELDSDFDGWEDCLDTDLDHVTTAQGDCRPWDATAFPDAPELCDGIDNDCDGGIVGEEDDDRDGFPVCAGDCDDHDGTMLPYGQELQNGYDSNCDAVVRGGVIGCATTGGSPNALLPMLAATFAAVVARPRRRAAGSARTGARVAGSAMLAAALAAGPAQATALLCPVKRAAGPVQIAALGSYAHDHEHGWTGAGVGLSLEPLDWEQFSVAFDVRAEHTADVVYLSRWEPQSTLARATLQARWHPYQDYVVQPLVGLGGFARPGVSAGPVLTTGVRVNLDTSVIEGTVSGWVHPTPRLGFFGADATVTLRWFL